MDNIKDYDDDGFELQFDDTTTAEERKYYVKAYTNVNMVADRRSHCTCCDTHIGTAPSAEKIIRMHPILRVTQCNKCYKFYNSGEFEKGEDGSELYCRWCGQGGDVYCCSDCPYVFCKKCIIRNLTRVALNDVTSNDNWKCFSCAPKILHHLRAQHWALVNFISKQKKKLEEDQKKLDHDVFVDAMNHDVSTCCQAKKKTIDNKKRKMSVGDSDDSEDSSWSRTKRNKKKSTSASNDPNSDGSVSETDRIAKRPTPKKSVTDEVPSTIKASPPKPSLPKLSSELQVKKITQPKINPIARRPIPSTSTAIASTAPVALVSESEETAQIDCTPDLFAFLVNRSYEQTHGSNETENSVVSSSTTPSTSKNQTPPANNSSSMAIQSVNSGQNANLEIPQRPITNNAEQFVRRVARSQVTAGSASQPVYHNYNGYRIDLNSAAQQSTVRLPNGKVIHVKKQTPLITTPNGPTRFTISAQENQSVIQRTIQTAIRPQILSQRPQSLPRPRSRQPTPVRALPTRPVAPPPPLLINSVMSGGMMHQPRPRMQAMPHSHMNFQQAQMQVQQMMMGSQNMSGPLRPPQSIHPPSAQIPSVTAGPSIAQSSQPQPRIYTNDQVGRARTQLERQIFNSISICNQIEGKLRTLMNSNAYKNVQKLPDVKELYIHLSYLFTYTNGRFQTVHDKCMEDMRRLGFKNDATSLCSGNVIDKYGSDVDDDDLEIVEPNHQTINLDSDDERTPDKNRSKSNGKNTPRKNTATPEVTQSNQNVSNEDVEAGVLLDISSSTENLECDVDISSLLQMSLQEEEVENGESLLSRMNDEVGIATPPDTENEQHEMINIANDFKLNSKATVCLKPVEKDYPDLMEKAIQKWKEIQADEADKENEKQSEKESEQEPGPSQPNDVGNLLEPISTMDSPDQSQREIEDETDSNVDNQNESFDTTKENTGNETEELNATAVIEKPEDQDKFEEGEPSVEQNVDKQNEIPGTENIENIEQNLENEVDKPQSPQIETTTAQQNADFNENEATSIDKNSVNDDNVEKNKSTEESHDEITSTSTAIDTDVEMIEIIDENATNENKNDGDVDGFVENIVENLNIDLNDASIQELVDDLVVEIETTQESNETALILSDLSDCNQLINEEISKVMNTNATLEAASFLDGDFENISSPDTFA